MRVVRTFTINGNSPHWLAVATVPVTENEVFEDSFAVIPEQALHQAEKAIEVAAALHTLNDRERHSLCSPMPFVGFGGPSNWLDRIERSSTRQHLTSGVTTVMGINDIDISDPGVLRALQDRFDGVLLLADALGQSNAHGRYVGFVRFFERAFASGPHATVAPLAAFLSSGQQGFQPEEVSSWLDARSLAFHADRRDDFYLEADVRPFVPRMEEAALDVLLNKEAWRSPNSARRSAWTPPAGSTSATGSMFVTKGKQAKFQAQILDGLSSYPLALAGPFDSLLPAGVWLTNEDGRPAWARRGAAPDDR